MSFQEGELLDLAVMGIGAGSSGAVAGFLKNLMPGVTEDIATIIAGGGLYYFGGRFHPLLAKFGAGVLIQGIGAMTKGLIPGITGQGGGSNTQTETQNKTTTLKSLALMEARRS